MRGSALVLEAFFSCGLLVLMTAGVLLVDLRSFADILNLASIEKDLDVK